MFVGSGYLAVHSDMVCGRSAFGMCMNVSMLPAVVFRRHVHSGVTH